MKDSANAKYVKRLDITCFVLGCVTHHRMPMMAKLPCDGPSTRVEDDHRPPGTHRRLHCPLVIWNVGAMNSRWKAEFDPAFEVNRCAVREVKGWRMYKIGVAGGVGKTRLVLGLKLKARARGWIEQENVSTLIMRVSTIGLQLYVLQTLFGVLRYHH